MASRATGQSRRRTACFKTNLFYEKSDEMAADIYTKAFTCPFKWQDVSTLINHWIVRAVKGEDNGKKGGTVAEPGTAPPPKRSHVPGLIERVQWFQADLDERGALRRWRAPPEPQPEQAGPEDSVWPMEIDVTRPDTTVQIKRKVKRPPPRHGRQLQIPCQLRSLKKDSLRG